MKIDQLAVPAVRPQPKPSNPEKQDKHFGVARMGTGFGKTIYVAGPMTGRPNFNFQAFHTATEKLRADGWLVYNPAEKAEESSLDEAAIVGGDTVLAVEKGFNFRSAYIWDLECVVRADAIYMLKGWEDSPGARGEHAVAQALASYVKGYQILYE